MVHDYYDAYDSRASRWLKVVVICLVGAFIAGGGFWMLTRDGKAHPGLGNLEATATGLGTESVTAPTATPISAAPAPPAPAETAATLTTAAASTASPSPTAAPAPTLATTSPETPAPTTVPEAAGPGYPTSSDGTPLPLIVTYDSGSITVTGYVPSQAAKDRVGLLASANSKTEALLRNNLVVNPDVPIGVGVRVIELDSVRFPEGSSEILPAHGTELQRVARVMEALPNVTTLVIGHADQRGDVAANFEISAERAAAVVDFLTYLGVSPTRLSSRAVGEADLLTLDDDDTALALNRRTEFIFYGVLIE